MNSTPIKLAALEVGRIESLREEKRAEGYRESTRKNRLSKDLHRRSLEALKRRLANAKAQNDSDHAQSAVGPFSEMSIAQVTAHKEASLKIDPSAQVMQLYHKLIDKLIYIAKEGIQKTTFFLNSTSFDSSILRGAQITITEFSTAPKIFNIQFSADPKALSFFELHAEDLQKALNEGGYRFKIGRIDLSLLAKEKKEAVAAINRDKEEENDR